MCQRIGSSLCSGRDPRYARDRRPKTEDRRQETDLISVQPVAALAAARPPSSVMREAYPPFLLYNNSMLTKTDFLTYLTSPMHLWAAKNGGIERGPSAFDQHLMDQGQVVEAGPSETVINEPTHPYTRSLLAATANAGNLIAVPEN